MFARARSRAADGGVRVGSYAAVVAVVVLGGLGALAALFHQPYLFPSVGPTVMVLAERPRSASAHPRSVVLGHVVAVAAGLLSLLVFGLWDAPPVLHAPSGARVGAVVVSAAVTTLVLQVLRSPHAPAGATTLIVSLGLLKAPRDLLAIVSAIMFVTAVATVLNIATGRRRTLHLRDSASSSEAPYPSGEPASGRRGSAPPVPEQRLWPWGGR